MKLPRLCHLTFVTAAIAALILGSACTHFDANKGTLTTCADNVGLDATYPNGAHLHIDQNLHSPVIHAYGSAGGRLIGAAGAAFVGYQGVKQGQQVAGFITAIAPSHYNRSTTRTSTPAPAKVPASTR